MSTDFSKLPQGVHSIALGIGDPNGILRGKRVPASHWPTICENGMALSMATFAIDMTCDVWDTPYVNFDNGYPDMLVFPNGPVYATPWEEGVAFCMGRVEGMDGKPVPIDPRNGLVRVVERAAKMGYEVQIGAELEFYLLDKETLKQRDAGIGVYSLARSAELEHVIGPIRRYLNDIGIPIEQSNPEYAAGQVEVNIRYGEALATADRVIAFRGMIKQIASSHGYVATFMSKPFFEESGSGFHMHHSVWKDGKNVFADNGKLSALGKNYVAGLQKRMSEMSLVGATTPNAYRRRQPYTFSPVNTTWGTDNRTVGLRIIDGSDTAVRVEKRDGAADCNPYNLLACEIAAGLDGIEQGLEPTPETTGNAYEEAGAEMLPPDLPTALELARGSQFMKDVMGEDTLAILAGQAERELEFFAQQVTDVERDRYLTNF